NETRSHTLVSRWSLFTSQKKSNPNSISEHLSIIRETNSPEDATTQLHCKHSLDHTRRRNTISLVLHRRSPPLPNMYVTHDSSSGQPSTPVIASGINNTYCTRHPVIGIPFGIEAIKLGALTLL